MVDFEKIEKDDHFIPDGMNGFERNTKRVIDCLTALVAMIVFSPLFLFCYIAVKREDGGKDKRMTKIGKFLREHHLDELPQLWNVFCGQMAFIGPRPERKFYIDQIMERDPRYRYLYQIRPGVTSYATLYNGYTDTIEKMLRRLRYDLFYLEHRSWGFDIKILWMTFFKIVAGKKF